MSFKMTSVCPKVLVKSHETYWILEQFHPILSAKLYIYIYMAVKGFMSGERDRDIDKETEREAKH